MSLINDALKRAREAQMQASEQPSGGAPARPRAPKGVNDLPVPMMPVATPARSEWLPVVGIGLAIFVLLTASGFFFWKWWEERRAWQPYAETPPDPEPEIPKPALIRPTVIKTSPPPAVVVQVPAPVTATNPPVARVRPPVPATNPVPVIPLVTPVVPPTVAVVPPVVPPVVTPIPPVTPVPPPVVPVIASTATNPPTVIRVPPVVPLDTKKLPPTVQVAEVQFPDLKLQGIIIGKKKITALVNGKTIMLGDRIEGASLVAIASESVIFEKSGARRELFLLR